MIMTSHSFIIFENRDFFARLSTLITVTFSVACSLPSREEEVVGDPIFVMWLPRCDF